MTITILDTRTFIARVGAVAALNYERDPETSGGYVAQVDGLAEAMQAPDAISAADLGAETSWSKDDDGAYFVWVAPRNIYRDE